MTHDSRHDANPWSDSSTPSAHVLDGLVRHVPRWLEGRGQDDDIVISTRIRLARNLHALPFPIAASASELGGVIDKVQGVAPSIRLLHDAVFLDIEKLEELDRKFLVERRLISPQFADSRHPAMAAVAEQELLSVMINEEDHLRIQSIQPGFSVRESWRLIAQLDDELAEHLEYAFSDQYGYLTSCPTNTGTGLRVSIFVHLAALATAGKAERVMRELAPSEIAVRGFYGEGTEVVGNIFQISNQPTLGRSEADVISRLEAIGQRLVHLEREARLELQHERRLVLEDQVFRALGILQNARLLSTVEFLTLLSTLRLGLDLEIVGGLDAHQLNHLMMITQPAHLQKLHRELIDVEGRDRMRALMVRRSVSHPE